MLCKYLLANTDLQTVSLTFLAKCDSRKTVFLWIKSSHPMWRTQRGGACVNINTQTHTICPQASYAENLPSKLFLLSSPTLCESFKFTEQEFSNFIIYLLSPFQVMWRPLFQLPFIFSPNEWINKIKALHRQIRQQLQGEIRRRWRTSSEVQHLTVYWARLCDFIKAYLIQN